MGPLERMQSSWQGILEFGKQTQTGALNNGDLMKQQLNKLEDIRRAILNQNTRTPVARASGPA